MQEVVNVDSARIVAERLKEARLATGMSTRAVAAQMLARFQLSISHTAIAAYEKVDGRASVPMRVLALLAELYERPLDWFLQRSRPLRCIRYRYTSSRVLVSERHQYELRAQHWLESYAKLERRLGERLKRLRGDSAYRGLSPSDMAEKVREDFRCGSQPIVSIISIMEEFGIRVIELASPFRIDGLAAMFGDELAVVLNPAVPNDRCRLNAAHELFHALNGDCEHAGETTKSMEASAFEFAGRLLIPETELRLAFAGRSAVKLVQAKERFGLSMAAMIYQAEKLGVIDARAAKWLWIQFAKRGWRANEPGHVRADRAIRFEKLLEQAVSEKRLQWSEAVSLLGVTRRELEDRVALAMGCGRVPQMPEEKGGPIALKVRADDK
jgi:Zn-dependent peptidase ImmA (M78 family)/transcriptional regulator with XRE-family HTH domain